MAQPPEAGPLRPQSSLGLVPVQPRVQHQHQHQQQPNLDALVEQHHPPGHHQRQQQQQQQNQQHPPHLHQHLHPSLHHLHHGQQQQPQQQQQKVLGSAQPPEALGISDVPTVSSGAHSPDTRSGCSPSPGIGDDKTGADGVLTADAHSHIHASVARPAEPAPAAHGGAAVPSHPDMSNTQPPPGPARLPVTYASPAAYPPAGMPPVSQYMYPVAPDPYRPNPTTLPSMRTLDHRQPQAQPQHGIPLGAHMAGPMTPAPAPVHMGYYGVHPHSHMYGLPDPNAMRFALAPGLVHDPRIALSGGRHKKEIKRRTKTGCLTCRKRRIKCDEAHPTCNNCKKSKRECLGYDPIFKQQQGPAAIQPAPTTQPPAAPAVAVAVAATVPSSSPHPYQASYPPTLPSNIAPDSAPSTAPPSAKTELSYDYSTAIDPALQGQDTAAPPGSRVPRYQPSNPGTVASQATGDSIHLRGGTPSSPSTLSALSEPQSLETQSAHTISPAKMKVDELIALGGAPPHPPSAPPSAEMLDEITKLYYEVYLPGLTLFFETRWYDLSKGRTTATNPTDILHNDPSLVSLFTSFIHTISKVKSTDPGDMVYSGHLELSVVWSLARLPLTAPLAQRQPYPGPVPAEDDPWEARGRLQVFETLLAGEILAGNPLTPPPSGGNIHPLRRNELEFWHHLATYLLQEHASASPADVSTRERCLSVMRSLLDGRENRDVLYSIAVLREYTAHWDASYSEQSVPSHLEESDCRSKLAVATRFIRDESTSTGGTTNVVRRFADLAYRAFVRPGVNVNRNRGRF